MKSNTAILLAWAVFVCCVVVGSLLPATSPVMAAVGRLHVSDKVLHFAAYLALSLLPVIGFRDRRRGVVAGLSMFLLGLFLEGAQHFAPGRAVESRGCPGQRRWRELRHVVGSSHSRRDRYPLSTPSASDSLPA